MVHNVNNIVYGLFPQGTYNLVAKIRCVQISRLWGQGTQVGDKYGRKEKQNDSLLLHIMPRSSFNILSAKQKVWGVQTLVLMSGWVGIPSSSDGGLRTLWSVAASKTVHQLTPSSLMQTNLLFSPFLICGHRTEYR